MTLANIKEIDLKDFVSLYHTFVIREFTALLSLLPTIIFYIFQRTSSFEGSVFVISSPVILCFRCSCQGYDDIGDILFLVSNPSLIFMFYSLSHVRLLL